MASRYVEYEGKVIARSNHGNYYELHKWNIRKDGEIEAIEKRLLNRKEVEKILGKNKIVAQ